MNNRPFGERSGLTVPPVSIGTMRFPADFLQSVPLARHAIDTGVGYVAAGRRYKESELALGRALRGGYRERVALSTKWCPWIDTKLRDDDDGSARSVRRRIEESLLRIDVDYLDFYQVWCVNSPETWETATMSGGMVDGIRKAIEDGLVGHTGFTTHDKPEHVVQYVEEADWAEAVTVGYHLLRQDYAPVLEAARRKGIGTVVMNPVGGGSLTHKSPVFDDLAERVGAVSLPDLAVRFVLSNPNVDTILCGVNKPSDIDDTVASANRGAFSTEQMEAIQAFVKERSPESVGFCTGCGYCMPCPNGVKIQRIMGLIYRDRYLGFHDTARAAYRSIKNGTAADCTRCGECEKKCTQGLKIMEELAWAEQEYGMHRG